MQFCPDHNIAALANAVFNFLLTTALKAFCTVMQKDMIGVFKEYLKAFFTVVQKDMTGVFKEI